MTAPRVVPSLDELRKSPEIIDDLPRDALAALYRDAARLEADLRARLFTVPAEGVRPSDTEDRAVGIDEACRLLNMTKDYVYRHWRTMGGYRDDDGHIKFLLSAIQRRQQRKSQR
jgi:hypothetical protein